MIYHPFGVIPIFTESLPCSDVQNADRRMERPDALGVNGANLASRTERSILFKAKHNMNQPFICSSTTQGLDPADASSAAALALASSAAAALAARRRR